MPELLSYWMEATDAQPLLRYVNEEIAALVAESEGVSSVWGQCHCRMWTRPLRNCAT